MSKHYLFFTRNVLPQPAAHLAQTANSANAAANLGYDTVLACYQPLDQREGATVFAPFRPELASAELTRFYNLQHRLKVAALPIPSPFCQDRGRWLNSSTLVTKYYLPWHLRSRLQLVQSRDWNFVEAAVRHRIPAIYEHHHHEEKEFPVAIVRSPYFQVAVTIAESVRQTMIHGGMPPEKAIWLHNGCNQAFGVRQPERASQWRQQLLGDRRTALVVYAGGLNWFKGLGLLFDAAAQLPMVQFALAGGNAEQVASFHAELMARQLYNVKLLGFLPQRDLAALLQAADLLLHPHRASQEASFTSPLKFFDYLASGTPIVATDIEPLREFRDLGAIAAWTEPDHTGQCVDAIRHSLAQCPRPADGFPTPTHLLQRFSWETRIQRILDHVEPSYHPQRTSEKS